MGLPVVGQRRLVDVGDHDRAPWAISASAMVRPMPPAPALTKTRRPGLMPAMRGALSVMQRLP